MEEIERAYDNFLKNRADEGVQRFLKPINPLSAREIEVEGSRYINFSSNDYLGLAQHPALKEAAAEWVERYGCGSTASRLVVGDFQPYAEIEEKIAKFKGTEAALVMASGYQCNASVLPALFKKDVLGAEPLVFADKLNHASMHAGCAAAGVKQIRYRHCDVPHLEDLLRQYQDNAAPKFILTESVFSMDGDIAPLQQICALAEEFGALVICDDAHASGILGQNGKGLSGGAHITIGTFSKAFGSFGAYIACSKIVKDYLINACGGVIYSTALPPSVWGTIQAALEIVPRLNSERRMVQQNALKLRVGLEDLGINTAQSETQIVPAIIGEVQQTLALSEALKAAGIWATAIRPPTVPHNTARIRFAVNAAHTEDDIAVVLRILSVFQNRQAA